jgi:DNA-binding SARP family transcriptional activator
LGGYSLELHGHEVGWRTLRPRVATMLRLLSLHPAHGIHEEILIDSLWREQPVDRGRHNLQAAISSLRQVLEPGRSRGEPSIVQRTGPSYALVLPEPSRVDIIDFREAIDRWRRLRFNEAPASHQIPVLIEAVGAYAGELLPEVGPAEWVLEERERLRLDAAAAAVALADLQRIEGDYAAAIRAAEWAIRIDATRDHAWRILLQVHALRGDIAGVERTRRRYAGVLDDLGIPEQLRARN